MDIKELEAFLTVADELHFGRAANLMHITRARVSQLIQRFERRIGGALFDRTSRRVALTPLGRQLYDDLAPAYRQIKDGIDCAIEVAGTFTGRIRVGYVGVAAGVTLTQVVKSFTDRYPGSTVSLREIQVDEVFRPLRERGVEVLLGRFPVRENDLVAGPVILSQPAYVALSARHPLAGRETVSLDELADESFLVTADTPGYLTDRHVPPLTPGGAVLRRVPQSTTFLHGLVQIANGEAVALVGEEVLTYYVRADVAYVRVPDAPPHEFGLMWRTAEDGVLLRAFADVAVQAGQGLPWSVRRSRD
ncbi:LysR family transcriptional regulator [Nonomuraea typhae]|uniref:LysR family transcriptional regulator n=1 Tax=Nonomuraea typhae TaxID=2603600 RepID=UPI0012F98954|nr:LysR family transcriptional regulator [Nonomuraea typhae]